MKKNVSSVYGLFLLLVFIISAISFYPSILPGVFLAATLVVASISMMGGLRAGAVSYVIVSLVIFALPIRDILGWQETLIRFLGFTLTSGFLAVLSNRLREYQSSITVKEKKLKIISDSLTDVLITIDNKSVITFVNPAVEKMFGWADKELIGQSLTMLMPEHLRDKHLKGFARYVKTREKTFDWKNIEVIGLRKDGTEFPIEVSYGEFLDGDEQYFSAIIRDITIRKEFDKKMSQLAAIVESTEDGIIGKDLNSNITSWNRGAERLFGYTKEEIIGKNITILFPDDKVNEEEEIVKKIVAGKRVSSYETFRKKKDGTIFPVSLSVSPIKDSTGRIIGASKIVRDISFRWKYEKNLKESDERYKSFIKNSTEGIWRLELRNPISTSLSVEAQIDAMFKEAYFAECNKAMAQMYGYNDEGDIIGKPLTFVLPDNEQSREHLRDFIENDYNLENAESEEIGAQGKTVYFSNSLVAMVEDGYIQRAWGVQRDITDRKAYLEEVNKAQERYKTFIENSDAAIWLIEYKNPIDTTLPVDKQIELMYAEGYTAEANQKVAELYEKDNIEDFIGKSTMMLSPRSLEADKFLKMYIKQGYSIVDFDTVAEKDGKVRYGSITFKGIIENKKLVRAWVVMRETTERKLQEQELEKGQERYQTFIETSEEGIWRVEFKEPIDTSLPHREQVEYFFAKGYIAEANEATAKILNIDNRSSLINKPLHQVAPRTMFDDNFLNKFLDDGYTANNYESMDTRNGKVFYYSTTMKGIVEDGLWIRTWMVRRDITAQKEYLMERERLLKAAENAKTQLEVASAEKDRFLANLSHELRTPLVAILGYSSMLLETEPDSENAKKMISTINKNAKLQVQLIEDLLDLSRIISGKIELKKDFFSLEEFAKDSIDTLRPQAAAKGLKIVERYDGCQFYGDRKRLSQVLLNLVSNAIKFTDFGEITVCIRCTPEYATIKVADTGIGIDPKNFNLLFQPFKQLDSSTTRAKHGLGLGLSIVKNITELHGGKVSVQSKLGEGSEFKVYLPVIQAPVVVEGQEGIHVTPSVTFDGVTMLLVEDDPDSAGFIEYLYKQKGADIDWVDSASKGRELIAKKKYDLYIFDLSMPEEDGISLINSVRKSGDTTKAVALTAFADSYYEQKALEAGFDMFLKKPSSLPELLSVIRLIR